MSKPNKARYRLSAVRASYTEAVGGADVELETDDGKVYTFAHPMFAGDDLVRQINEAEGDEPRAKLLLGDQWDAFVKSGGDATGVMLVWVAARNEMQETLTKHRPPKQ